MATSSKTQPVEQDGKRLTRWKHDGDVRAWDLETGRLLRTCRHEPPRGTSEMQLFKDGTRHGRVLLWDLTKPPIGAGARGK
jgi:hypothetical protein